ncbi:hypothetical protein GGI43DRAFT_257520 [Trichoderma evansii]
MWYPPVTSQSLSTLLSTLLMVWPQLQPSRREVEPRATCSLVCLCRCISRGVRFDGRTRGGNMICVCGVEGGRYVGIVELGASLCV